LNQIETYRRGGGKASPGKKEFPYKKKTFLFKTPMEGEKS